MKHKFKNKRITQDKTLKSDFDRFLRNLRKAEKSVNHKKYIITECFAINDV